MDKPYLSTFQSALVDFHEARRKANLQAVLSRLRGEESPPLLSYDEVRARLGGVESSSRELADIPLASIVGTVSRYNDFTRTLLPLKPSDSERWARVRVAADGMQGLPPIEVYQIGEAYFILDGHHRASVVKELGATHIQAYVRKVRTLVPLSPDDNVDDVILKAEYTEFLSKTAFNEIKPGVDLRVTAPGQYSKLLEHISVHRYFQGIDERRPITYHEAVAHWYDTVYSPVASIIRERNILKDFPERTETDLYVWIMEHRSVLEDELGWKVDPETAADDLTVRFSRRFPNVIRRLLDKFFGFISPRDVTPWIPDLAAREQRDARDTGSPFENILVAVSGDETGWEAFKLAAHIAEREQSVLGGVFVQKDAVRTNSSIVQKIQTEFDWRTKRAGLSGRLAIDQGDVSRVLYERSFWADLVVLRLLFPPPFAIFNRFRSGLYRLMRNLTVPILMCPPGSPAQINRVLLVCGQGHRSDQALFLAAYLGLRWKINLTALAAGENPELNQQLNQKARAYFTAHELDQVEYHTVNGDPAKCITQQSQLTGADLIIMGGYESGFLRELLPGSTVDQVLWSTNRPVLIC
ncbi:MAG: universal stress protein [Anaerolineae bacterium]|nr:universal stress protein [Anaerolineae bacterium]